MMSHHFQLNSSGSEDEDSSTEDFMGDDFSDGMDELDTTLPLDTSINFDRTPQRPNSPSCPIDHSPVPNDAFFSPINHGLFSPFENTSTKSRPKTSLKPKKKFSFATALEKLEDPPLFQQVNPQERYKNKPIPFQFSFESSHASQQVNTPSKEMNRFAHQNTPQSMSKPMIQPTFPPTPSFPQPPTPSYQQPMPAFPPTPSYQQAPPTPSLFQPPTPSFPPTPSTPYLEEPPTPNFIDAPTPKYNDNLYSKYQQQTSTPRTNDYFSLSQPTPKSTPGPLFSHVVTAVPTPDFYLLPETPRKRNSIRSRIKGNNNNLTNTPAIHTPEHFSKATPKLTVAQARLHLSENFDKLQQVGEGSFSRVFKAHHIREDKWYAIKVLKRPIQSDSQRQNIIRELQYVKQLNHPHVLTYVFSWEQENIVHFQMELCELGSMSHFITEWQKKYPCKNFDENTLWKFFADIILGLHHIHCQNLVHRDIKPGNIFVDANHNLKIGDFGLAVPEGYEDAQEGDSRYLAPEVLDDIVTKAADIFSLGATMFELACLIEMPKDDDLWNALRSGGVSKLKHFPQEYSNEMKVLIEMMMHPDYTKRPTTDQLIEHPRIIAEIERRRQAMHDNGEYITQVLSPPSSINPFKIPAKLRKFDTEDQILGDFTSATSNNKSISRKPKRNLMACFNNIAESGL